MPDQVVVITGASSGIGAALAKLVASKGARVVLAARRERELEAVATLCGAQALPVVTDVTQRFQVQRLLDKALEKFGQVDVWVNNAGQGISRPTADLTDDDFDQMMLINVKSALYGMQVALSHFKPRRRGHILNVSSMLGRLPLASVRSAYSASKAALNSLTASLRMDLRQEYPDIHVSLVSPGVVATEFGLHAMHGGGDSRTFPFAQTAEEVAAVIAAVIEKPQADVYTRPSFKQQLVAYYGAEDLAQAESQPPFFTPPRR